MTGLRPGDLLLVSPFLRGQNVFEGVLSGTIYVSMLLTGAVTSGPICREFCSELLSDPNLVPCVSRQA